MAAAKGACLNHVSRESSDIKRLAKFYQEIFGFEEIESPKFEFDVIWLKLPPSFYLHLIERNPESRLPEGPWCASSAVADPKNLRRGHHICFSIANFDSFVQALEEKGIETHQSSVPNRKIKQVFFFDPDDMGALMRLGMDINIEASVMAWRSQAGKIQNNKQLHCSVSKGR